MDQDLACELRFPAASEPGLRAQGRPPESHVLARTLVLALTSCVTLNGDIAFLSFCHLLHKREL